MEIMTTTLDLDREYAQLLAVMQPKVIESEAENEVYLAEVSKLMQIGEDLSLAQEKLLRLLVALIEIFEDQQYQLNPATPLEILRELMGVGVAFPSENRSLKQKDLLPVFGSQGIASEVLSGKRSISKSQAKALGDFFRVSSTLFL
jgi:HTH-type transcriptional regulator / antitoxin HigA